MHYTECFGSTRLRNSLGAGFNAMTSCCLHSMPFHFQNVVLSFRIAFEFQKTVFTSESRCPLCATIQLSRAASKIDDDRVHGFSTHTERAPRFLSIALQKLQLDPAAAAAEDRILFLQDAPAYCGCVRRGKEKRTTGEMTSAIISRQIAFWPTSCKQPTNEATDQRPTNRSADRPFVMDLVAVVKGCDVANTTGAAQTVTLWKIRSWLDSSVKRKTVSLSDYALCCIVHTTSLQHYTKMLLLLLITESDNA